MIINKKQKNRENLYLKFRGPDNPEKYGKWATKLFEDKIKQRLSLGGSYKFSLKPISFKTRTKFQRTYEDEEGPDALMRNKISIHYKWNKKIEPYVSGEIFHIHNTGKDQFDEYRFSFGLAVNLPRKNSIKIFYVFKKEDITKSNPSMINVFGVGYGFE